ncbi:hypothetical protein JQF37_01870 [Pseudomonas sp. MIL9]|uniref:hypothetical protein n=1 Tax=Pseudomonas sp. MIL9 TaxID=2807620 RepID=UPI00194EC0E5|nr:hypothetical protein [Pseudomonas sp. MIL9]MBM6442374.1 hypothetical protein [Pseudomonas sp. MIL9]
MTDHTELKRLAEGMEGWDNLTRCWPCDENGPDWQVGQVDEDGYRYPVLTIDTEQYDAESHASTLAKYYAAANPVAVLSLIGERDKLKDENEVARMRIKELDLLFGRYILAMRSAVIEENAEKGMEWIYNSLAGPGELPPEDETDAQAYFDREIVAVDNGMQEVLAFHDARRAAKEASQ